MAQLKFILDGNGNKVYPITVANGVVYIKSDGTQLKASDLFASILAAQETFAAKVSGATSGNFAGLDANGNLTDSGKKAADFATAAQGAKADSALQQANITTGSANGTISVKGTNVAVKGLGSAAYTASTAYDAAGAATAVKTALIGTTSDTASSDTIKGAKKYADAAAANAIAGLAGALVYKGTVASNSALPTNLGTDDKGAVYVVSANGTYANKAMEVGDYLIWNGTGWDGLNGENQVSNSNATLAIGSAKTIATVDGVNITVTQVEDTTKLECSAVSDTTDYADVASAFTA